MPRTKSSLMIAATLSGLLKQRSTLDDAISALSKLNGSAPHEMIGPKPTYKKRRRSWSKASREKLSLAMKKHWEERDKKKKTAAKSAAAAAGV